MIACTSLEIPVELKEIADTAFTTDHIKVKPGMGDRVSVTAVFATKAERQRAIRAIQAEVGRMLESNKHENIDGVI